MDGTVALIGGTGPEGKGLAARFARAGLHVVIGSRSAERGEAVAREVGAKTGKSIHGAGNEDAAGAGAIVLITLPYEAQRDTLSPLAALIANKVVVSTVVPLEFSRRRVAMLDVPAGSAAEEIQKLLPDARVAGAFQSLSAGHLADLDYVFEADVIVCGDDPEAVASVIELAELIENVRGVKGGPLANCRYVEALTALQINVNRLYKAETHVKLVGI